MNICSTYESNYRDRQIRRSCGKPRRCWPRKKSRTSYRPKKSRPPQLVASFIPSQAYNVGFWHLADKPAAPAFVRYWSNSGQQWILACDCLSAFDPTATLAVHCGNGFDLAGCRSSGQRRVFCVNKTECQYAINV